MIVKKAVIAAVIASSSLLAFAEDGHFTGAINTTFAYANQVNVERVIQERELQGRNDNTNGSYVIRSENTLSKIVLPGRND